MSAIVRRLRPRVPVNYRVDADSDADAEEDDAEEADAQEADNSKKVELKPFKLFELPEELRVLVYKELLIDPNGVHLRKRREDCMNDLVVHVAAHDDGVFKAKKQLSTNLLATCKVVYEETRFITYRQPFVFDDPNSVHTFLHSLKPSTINLLKDITIVRIRAYGINNNPLLSGLRDAMGLQHLRLGNRITASNFQFITNEYHIGVQIVNRFYQDASYFIRPFIEAHGVDALLQVMEFHPADKRGNPTHPYYRATWTAEQEAAVISAMKHRLLFLTEKRKSIMSR